MSDTRSKTIAEAKKAEELRSRVIYWSKKGKKAPKLRAAYARSKARLAVLRKQLASERAVTAREKAIKYAPSLLGEREVPPGSNRGRRLTGWQSSFGSWLVGQPWCGVLCGVALRNSNVKVNSRIAAVAFIEDDARAGRNGFKEWKGRTSGKPGDLLVLFGRGVHVGFIEKSVKGGYRTIEGNTSSGNGGSQSNGGGSYRRFRPYSQVHGIAVPRYPKT